MINYFFLFLNFKIMLHNTTQHNTTVSCWSLKQKLLSVLLICFTIFSCNFTDESAENALTVKTETRDATLGPGCGVDIGNQCDPPDIKTEEFHLDNVAGYPNCTFNVSVTYNECTDGGGITEINVGNFSLVTYVCPQYTIDLQNAINAGGIVLDNFVFGFEKKLYEAFEFHYFNLNPSTCLTGVQRNFNWYLDACKQYCITSVDIEGTNILIFNPARCGTGCCKRDTRMCKDPITGQINKTTTYYIISTANCGTILPDWGRRKCDYVTNSCILTCQ